MYLEQQCRQSKQACLCDSDQSSVVGLGVFEADDLQSQRLLHFGHVCLPCCLQQRVAFELIYEERVNDTTCGVEGLTGSIKHASRLTRQPVFELWRGCHVHSTLAVTVKEGRVGAMAQQQGTHLHPVLRRSLVQRCELPEVHGVHTGTVLQSEKLK